ncbi:S-adenosylmethionine-dependent methyltransferase Ecym_4245 [Eremothecium cymbalariae DBVPG|uniref:Methyltransferase small domain-containing protein n=1 Tax=Eremothecium cymbalariae (strain CBS 270.75 / DBVPG 7215 / KCTC 17166 / NRRL Y-17582) TaxID=931890 RepID=G8JTF7_ERECY|nr:hypothetical protein Ecym_4245 [Eremothecium cymbalariae DBVPG\
MLSTPDVKCDYTRIYEPSEDSFLLLDSLEKDKCWLNEKFQKSVSVVCEIGSGSGIVTTFMMKHGLPNQNSIYLPTDINPWATEAMLATSRNNHCEEGFLAPLRMDLTSGIREGSVDLLVFNPPYVPAPSVPSIPSDDCPQDKWLDLALEGGEDGMIVTTKLLNKLHDVLSHRGIAYILFCARNHPEIVAQGMRSRGWVAEIVEHRKAGWEVLSVYKFYRQTKQL